MPRQLNLRLVPLVILIICSCSDTTTEKTVDERTNSTSGKIHKNSTDNSIKFYQDEIKNSPNNYHYYTKLGEAYIQKGRESGLPDFYTEAENVLIKSLQLSPDNYLPLVYLGQVNSFRHQFQKTLNYAAMAIKLKPEDSYAYGILGDAYLELGEYEKAGKVYEMMLSLGPGLDSYSRISHLRELMGDVQGAVESMQKAIQIGIRQNLPKENIAWAEDMLGDLYFNTGDLEKAESQYTESLKTFENYHYALAGLARVKAAEKKEDQAIDLYRRAIAIIPLPVFVTSLGNLYEKIGNYEEARRQYKLVEYIGLLSTINKDIYNREIAHLYADLDRNLTEALQLAKKVAEVKKDIYTYDTLAWVLYKNNQPLEALDASLKSLRLGTKDANLFFHAGMIYFKLGELDLAKDYLSKALSTNPYFHLIYSEVARNTLRDLNNKSLSLR